VKFGRFLVIKEKNPQSIVQLFLLDDTLTSSYSSLSHVISMRTAPAPILGALHPVSV
jgi:uncharacterized protein YjiK